MKFLRVLLVSTILVFGFWGVSSANLLTNGDFGTGDFTGWTLSGNTGFTGVEAGYPVVGVEYDAYLGPVGSDGYLSQTVATTSGEVYQVSWYLASYGGTPNDFGVTFGAVTLFSIVDMPGQGYTYYAYDYVATGASTTLTINFRNDPGWQYLADVSVDPISAVPEPCTMLLLGSGLVGLAAFRKKLRG